MISKLKAPVFQYLGEILLQGKGHNGYLTLLVHDDVIDQLKSSELLEQNGFLTPDSLKDDAETLACKLFNENQCWKGQVSSEILPTAQWRDPSDAAWVSNRIHQAEISIASSRPLHCDYIVQIADIQPAPDVKVINWLPEMGTELPASYPFVREATLKH